MKRSTKPKHRTNWTDLCLKKKAALSIVPTFHHSALELMVEVKNYDIWWNQPKSTWIGVWNMSRNQYDSHSITTAGSASMDFVIIYHSMWITLDTFLLAVLTRHFSDLAIYCQASFPPLQCLWLWVKCIILHFSKIKFSH